MVHSLASSDMERATLMKAKVNMTPLWADEDSYSWDGFVEDDSEPFHSSYSTIESETTILSLAESRSLPRTPASTVSGSTATPTWSDFAIMNSISTVSDRLPRRHQEHTMKSSAIEMSTHSLNSLDGTYSQSNLRRHHPWRLSEIFKLDNNSNGDDNDIKQVAVVNDCSRYNCVCSCPKHRPFSRRHLSMSGISARSKKQYQKQSIELTRGYPTGQCVSSLEPPPKTTWDERDPDDSLLRERRSSIRTNTAINFENFKMFLNSPLFSNILKCLIVLVSVLLFIIALDAIIILHKNLDQESTNSASSANMAFIFTLVLSILTIIYSCFTIILESKRPPEGMDTSYSRPLIVIFSEIIASIVWAQVMSATTCIYMWTFGCMSAEEKMIWRQSELSPDQSQVVERLCYREGAMVGLEVLLVLLLIFNFYTHLAQNFRFIRDVL